MKKTLLALLMLAGLTSLACAQFLGYVANQTVSQTLFTNKTTTGRSGVINNLGQSSHWLIFCSSTSSGTGLLSLRLEGSPDGVNFVPISPTTTFQPTTTPVCNLIEGAGWYPIVVANVVTITGTGTAVSAFYSGQTAPVNSASANKTPVGNASDLAFQSQIGQIAFFSFLTFTNPAASSVLQDFQNALSSTRSAYLKTVTLSCTAACTVTLEVQTSCTGGTPGGALSMTANTGGVAFISSQTTLNSGCTRSGSSLTVGTYLIPAGQTLQFDISGWRITPGQGMDFLMSSTLTGNLSILTTFYEN